MKLIIDIKNTENIPENPDIRRYEEIVTALITSGALDGVRQGQAILHFDAVGDFRGVELNYWPYRKRTQ